MMEANKQQHRPSKWVKGPTAIVIGMSAITISTYVHIYYMFKEQLTHKHNRTKRYRNYKEKV